MLIGSCAIRPGSESRQMMTYQFRCSEHGAFEVKQTIIETHEAVCPTCNTPAQRVYSALGRYYDRPKSLWFKNGTREQL